MAREASRTAEAERTGPDLQIDVSAIRHPRAVPPSRLRFPDPRTAPRDGFLGHGGDLAPGTILEAYASGVFPWPHQDVDELWFCPDPRAVIPIGELHVSRRLARTMRRARFAISIDRAFSDVLTACAVRAEGTWITPGYRRAYLELHQAGWAHSFEVWHEGKLAGGLYGIALGTLFGAESMFHTVTDASKVAMVAMMQYLERRGFTLADVQMLTPHLARMGAVEISRLQYLEQVDAAVGAPQAFAGEP
jgi:leucyl/phenylalanyl-tRNA--protein transferase